MSQRVPPAYPGRVLHPSVPRDARGTRLIGVDAVRGVALLGMMAVHVLPDVERDGSTTLPHLVAGGRSAATFAVLAGVGLALATGGPTQHRGRAARADAAATLVRALLIGIIGIALGHVGTQVAVILPYYAVLFVLAAPLLRAPPGPLFAAAAAIAVGMPVLSHVLRRDVAEPFRDNPTFHDLADRTAELLVVLVLTGYYPAFAWAAYICTGLAVGRLRLHRTRVAGAIALGGAALAVATALASDILLRSGGLAAIAETQRKDPDFLREAITRTQYGVTDTDTWWWLAVRAPHSATPFDLLHTTGTALALLGLLLLLARPRFGQALLRPVAAAGSMPLTLYTAHVLLLGTGWLPADEERSFALQVAGALVVATLWRTFARRGPLEEAIVTVTTAVRARVR